MQSLRPYVLSAVASVALCDGMMSPANAQTFSSSYTSTAAKDCRTAVTGRDGGLRVCAGKAGLVVVISEDDLRETVSVGRNRATAEREPASHMSFGPFNSTTATIEWRAADGKAFAMIQRWHIADNDDLDKSGRPTDKGLLVVTRLPPGPVCHVAYVDVRANPDNNELARQAADQHARNFNCSKDAVKVIGANGRAVELAIGR